MDKKPIPNVLYHPIKTPGLFFWRLIWPAFHLSMKNEITYSMLRGFARDPFPYVSSDVVVFQRFGNKYQTEYIKKIAEFKERGNFRIIYDIDDVIFFDDVPDYHFSKIEDDYSQEAYTKELIALCDEVSVSTPFLKEYYQKETGQDKITVLPNKIPFFWAGHYYSAENVIRNYRKHKDRPRIIYAGSPAHIDCTGGENCAKDDFSMIGDFIEKTRKEFKWIFIAAIPIRFKEYLVTGEMEFYPWQPVGALPKLISTLEGNMMIAPLSDNAYNRAKSNIKLLEAAAHGIPIACQDLLPYKEAPILFKDGQEMVEKIRKTLSSEDVYVKESLKGRAIVDKHWLEQENNIGMYKDVYTYPYGDPRRQYV